MTAAKPWKLPLLCAGLAYGGGIFFGILSFVMMDHKSVAGWGFLLSLVSTLIVAILDTIAFIGGIVATVKVHRSGSSEGIVASIAAAFLGFVGYFGVLLLLINSTLYQYSPR